MILIGIHTGSFPYRVPRSDKEFFVSSCKDTPIRLWDVDSGQVSIYKSRYYPAISDV